MNRRQEEVLRTLIEEYIDRGEPVSSGFLTEQYPHWGVSPATIRNELLSLTREGFLEQPHTSAGRVPSEKGYRFFVDHFLGQPDIEERKRQALEQFSNILQLSDFLASESHSLVLSCRDPEEVYEAGLFNLLEEPEFSDHEFLIDFIKEAERLRQHFDQLIALANGSPHLYIGHEGHEIMGDNRFSFLLTPLRGEGIALFFNSTRMDYSKSLALANYLSNYHER